MIDSTQSAAATVSPASIAFVVGTIALTWKWLKSKAPKLQPVLAPVAE